MAFEIYDAEIIHSSGAAVKVRAPIFGEDTWIPYSQIDDDSEVFREGDKGTLIIKDWWAEKEGWE